MSEVGGGDTRVREGEHGGVERSLLTVPPDCKCVCANDGERECEREREGGRDGELRSSSGGAVFVFFFGFFSSSRCDQCFHQSPCYLAPRRAPSLCLVHGAASRAVSGVRDAGGEL